METSSAQNGHDDLSPAASATLIDDPGVVQNLRKIVSTLSYQSSVRQDLMQEALIHLWRLQQERPGQRKSWYLQNCRFRIQHYLATGRSLDSPKRRSAQTALSFMEVEGLERTASLTTPDNELETASANDLVEALEFYLRPIECDVLRCLAEGFSTTEIARQLGLSSPTVVKYRRKIARLASVLESMPAPRRHPAASARPRLQCEVKLGDGRCRITNVKLANWPDGEPKLSNGKIGSNGRG